MDYLEAEVFSRGFESFENLLFVVSFVALQAFLDVFPAVAQCIVKEHSEFARGGDIGNLPAAPGADASVKATQGEILAAGQTLRDHAEKSSCFASESWLAFTAFATLPRTRGQAQPCGEVFGAGPTRHVGADLGQELHQAVVAQTR